MIAKIVKWIFVALLIGIALMICVSVAVDRGSRIGACLGLLLGSLLGPSRIAGVDFRQWFKDPGTPSEVNDDSPIGLMRVGFHNVSGAATVGLVALLAFVSAWMPQPCSIANPWHVFDDLPGGVSVIHLMTSCSGAPAATKVLAGTLAGVVIMHAVVNAVWCLGLFVGVPAPVWSGRYLADAPPPRLPRKEETAGRRRLIICCDGTWNWPESRLETNVVRLVRAITPCADGISQIVHYHQGVGTGNFIDRIAGGGAGIGLSASVKACYGFLVDNYQDGDEIFLFGFSRGAYVARALGGFIGLVGMMRKHEMDSFADVWNWYWQPKEDRDQEDLTRLAGDRRPNIEIECIGVWDTVGALGIPGTRFCARSFSLHQTELGDHVRHAFQALAIDETRGNFQAAIWVPYSRARHGGAARPNAAADDDPVQVLEQVWFPGVHSNVGGGYERHGYSDATFLWMVSALRGRNLLGLEDRCIVGSLDTLVDERYPQGRVENSRTGFWSWIGSPVPRPVGIVTATEKIHESVGQRPGASPARQGWLGVMGRAGLGRTPSEINLDGRPRPPLPQAPDIPKKLDPCSWILQYINPRG